jgi:transcriptional regulator with XRE-family HTH domain
MKGFVKSMERVQQLISIRDAIRIFCSEKNLTIEQIADATGISRYTLSSIMRGVRSVSLEQLDKITEALGFEKGALYQYYEHECYFPGKDRIRFKRSKEFILKCCELNLTGPIKRLVRNITLQGKRYFREVFELAEMVNQTGQYDTAILLYKGVIGMGEAEYSDSEIITICYYRLFLISLKHQNKNTTDFVIPLLRYIRNFPDNLVEEEVNKLTKDANELKKNAYLDLIDYFFNREHWWKVIELCDQYLNIALKKKDYDVFQKILIIKAKASFYQGDYKQTKTVIEEYKFYMREPKNEIIALEKNLELFDYSENSRKEYLAWLENHPDHIKENLPIYIDTVLDVNELRDLDRFIKIDVHKLNEVEWTRIDLRYYLSISKVLFHHNEIEKGIFLTFKVAERAIQLNLPGCFFDSNILLATNQQKIIVDEDVKSKYFELQQKAKEVFSKLI